MSELLPKLGDAAGRLNKSFDAISERVTNIEFHLANECKLGIHTIVWQENNPLGLAYLRWGREWRIVVVFDVDEDGQVKDSKPWSDCNREIKLSTVSLIPMLLADLTDEADRQAKAAEAALAAIPDVAIDIPF